MILVTGSNGFLGKYICKMLDDLDLLYYKFRSSEYDLTDQKKTDLLFDNVKPSIVIHAGARLGGIKDNIQNPYYYYRDNIQMGINVINNVIRTNVKHLINIATCCSYPVDAKQPFNENDLNNGKPAKANYYYGIAKREIVNYSEIASDTFGFKLSNLISTNLFGIDDDFRPQTSHVIPALIRKISHAKRNNNALIVWGNRSVTRDFITPDYLCDHIKLLLKKNIAVGRVNVSSGNSTSIGEIVDYLCNKFNFEGKVLYQTNKPTGQKYRRLSQIKQHKKFYKMPFNFWHELDLLCDHYIKNESNILENNKNDKF